MALAEASVADAMVSKCGFDGNPFDQLYMNDFVLMALIAGIEVRLLTEEEKNRIYIGWNKSKFPYYLSRKPEIDVKIFHRKRKFYSIISRHASQIIDNLTKPV